jgi:hypothetical protein
MKHFISCDEHAEGHLYEKNPAQIFSFVTASTLFALNAQFLALSLQRDTLSFRSGALARAGFSGCVGSCSSS